MLIALGISLIIGLQTIVNVCVSTELMPNTGIPFPFLSSGLSSLIGNMFMIGVLLNVGLQAGRPKERKRESFVI
jgi:rod shape determining protein RodA